MIRANISELRNGLSAYLRRVRRGESVLILDRKVPVAWLAPVDGLAILRQESPVYEVDPDAERELEEEARIARLTAAGVISRASRGSPLETVRSWGPLPGMGLVEAVLANRREDDEKGYR